jgi:hypothetical protein
MYRLSGDVSRDGPDVALGQGRAAGYEVRRGRLLVGECQQLGECQQRRRRTTQEER